MEQLWERSEEGRKETNRELSTKTWKESTRERAGEKGESEEAKAETHTGKTTERQKREERKGRNRRLSSRKESGSGRKKAEAEQKMQEAKAEGKHSWNSCGSEARKGEKKHTGSLSTKTGKDERKRTGSRVRRTGKEGMGNQAGKNGENRESESGSGALRKPL